MGGKRLEASRNVSESVSGASRHLPVLIDEDGAVSLKAVPVVMQLQPAPVVPHLVAAVRVPARHRGAAHCVVVHILRGRRAAGESRAAGWRARRGAAGRAAAARPQDLLDVGLALFGLEHVVHARPGRRLAGKRGESEGNGGRGRRVSAAAREGRAATRAQQQARAAATDAGQ